MKTTFTTTFEISYRIGIPIYILHGRAELLVMLRRTYNNHRFRSFYKFTIEKTMFVY